MFMHHWFGRRGGARPWLAGATVALVASFTLAGCDLSGLTGSSASCTPQTCDYVVNTLVAVNGTGGATLLADTENAVYQFDGSKWNKVGAENAVKRDALLASPSFTTDKTLFLGNTTSTDSGATWTPICAIVKALSPNFGSDHTAFAVDATVGGTVSGGSSNGTPVPSTAKCPSNQGAFYISTDGGQTWNPIAGPQGAGDPDPLVVSPSYQSDKTLFATFTINLSPALYKSTDSGQTWTKVLDGRQSPVVLSTNFAADHTVIAVSSDKVQQSTDGGQTWATLNTPVTAGKVGEIAFSPNYASDKTIALVSSQVDTGSTEPHGTFISTDGGATFTATGSVTVRGLNTPAFLFSPNFASDKTVYTSSQDQGIGPAKSTDLGKTWTPINSGLDLLPPQG